MKAILLFLYRCLLASANCGPLGDIQKVELEAPLEKASVQKVRDFLSVVDVYGNDNVVEQYLNLIQMSLSPTAGEPLLVTS